MSEFRDRCYSCGYKQNVPGNAHIRCAFAWAKSNLTPPPGSAYGVSQGWYIFPLLFDPTWMLEPCGAWAEEAAEETLAGKVDPLLELLTIFRSVGRL